jgi:hypothetical protein
MLRILSLQRSAVRTAGWTYIDRIPRDPGPIAHAALDSNSQATEYYASRYGRTLIDAHGQDELQQPQRAVHPEQEQAR